MEHPPTPVRTAWLMAQGTHCPSSTCGKMTGNALRRDTWQCGTPWPGVTIPTSDVVQGAVRRSRTGNGCMWRLPSWAGAWMPWGQQQSAAERTHSLCRALSRPRLSTGTNSLDQEVRHKRYYTSYKSHPSVFSLLLLFTPPPPQNTIPPACQRQHRKDAKGQKQHL